VPAAAAGVSAVAVSPNSGSGLQQTFTLHYSDGAGATDLSTVWAWFNATFASSAANSCMVYYSRPSNTLNLINDAGTAWLSAPVGSSTTLANGQCSVNASSVSVNVSGTDLLLTLSVTFSATYNGAKNVYLWAGGGTVNSGWQTLGVWTVP
jgi:hypothetical protein